MLLTLFFNELVSSSNACIEHTSPSALAMSNNSPITQVSQYASPQTNLQPSLLTRLMLDLRGRRFSVDRETIMNLPESVLLCLFPNGLVLSRQSMALSASNDDGEHDEEEELYGVDVRRRPRRACNHVSIVADTLTV